MKKDGAATAALLCGRPLPLRSAACHAPPAAPLLPACPRAPPLTCALLSTSSNPSLGGSRMRDIAALRWRLRGRRRMQRRGRGLRGGAVWPAGGRCEVRACACQWSTCSSDEWRMLRRRRKATQTAGRWQMAVEWSGVGGAKRLEGAAVRWQRLRRCRSRPKLSQTAASGQARKQRGSATRKRTVGGGSRRSAMRAAAAEGKAAAAARNAPRPFASTAKSRGARRRETDDSRQDSNR